MRETSQIVAPISAGELIDKITILRIKAARFTDASKLHHVNHELGLLEQILSSLAPPERQIDHLIGELQQTNELLWDVEDNIRICERNRDFGHTFIDLARSVYRHNDRRCAIKLQINQLLGSDLVEQKSYRVESRS